MVFLLVLLLIWRSTTITLGCFWWFARPLLYLYFRFSETDQSVFSDKAVSVILSAYLKLFIFLPVSVITPLQSSRPFLLWIEKNIHSCLTLWTWKVFVRPLSRIIYARLLWQSLSYWYYEGGPRSTRQRK